MRFNYLDKSNFIKYFIILLFLDFSKHSPKQILCQLWCYLYIIRIKHQYIQCNQMVIHYILFLIHLKKNSFHILNIMILFHKIYNFQFLFQVLYICSDLNNYDFHIIYSFNYYHIIDNLKIFLLHQLQHIFHFTENSNFCTEDNHHFNL